MKVLIYYGAFMLEENNSDEMLKRAAFKLDYGDGIFAYAIYRPIVYLILKKLRNRRISPNKITLLAMIFYILAGTTLIVEYGPEEGVFSLEAIKFLRTIFASPAVFGLNVGAYIFLILYNVALVLDCLDGAVARYFSISNPVGRMLDCFSDSLGHLVVMVGLILMFPEYAALIGSVFFLYYALALTYMSYMFELVKIGKIPDETIRPLFKIGEFKILVGTLDNFVMAINGILIVWALNLDLGLYLLAINIFWGILLLSFTVGVGLARIDVTK